MYFQNGSFYLIPVQRLKIRYSTNYSLTKYEFLLLDCFSKLAVYTFTAEWQFDMIKSKQNGNSVWLPGRSRWYCTKKLMVTGNPCEITYGGKHLSWLHSHIYRTHPPYLFCLSGCCELCPLMCADGKHPGQL